MRLFVFIARGFFDKFFKEIFFRKCAKICRCLSLYGVQLSWTLYYKSHAKKTYSNVEETF